MCNYQRIFQPLIITSYLTQKHLNYHLKGTTSEKSAEMYGEGNERQLCVGDCTLGRVVLHIIYWSMFVILLAVSAVCLKSK